MGWLTATTDQWIIDRCLMESLLLLSSCEAARLAAATWLSAFDAALAGGAAHAEAHALASEMWARLVSAEFGDDASASSMLASHVNAEARPPPDWSARLLAS
jgi:hypothetical protein